MKVFAIDTTQGPGWIYNHVAGLAQEYRFRQNAFSKSFSMVIVHNSVYTKITRHCGEIMKSNIDTSKGVKMCDAMFIGSNNIDKNKIYLL